MHNKQTLVYITSTLNAPNLNVRTLLISKARLKTL